MKPIAIFYHCLTHIGSPPALLPDAVNIIRDQIEQLKACGLLDACQEFVVGLNGGSESWEIANLIIPAKAKLILHGLESRAENLTIVALWEWAKTNPDWNILYFHSKGATHAAHTDYAKFSGKWRDGMMKHVVFNWRQCVADLENHDIVCAHWMWNLADGTQHIPAGNFLWITSNFVATLPDIHLRDRIKVSGIANVESRYEAEVFWGNGKRPNVKSYLPNGGDGVP